MFSKKKEMKEAVAYLEKLRNEQNPIKYMESAIGGVEDFEKKIDSIIDDNSNEAIKGHKEQFCALVVNFYLEMKEKNKDNSVMDLYYNNIRKEADFILEELEKIK